MGFFKNLFKRKEGGTVVGNLLRGGASAATGGILGSGAGLRKWEQEQQIERQKEINKGYQIGQDLVNKVAVPAMGAGNATDPTIGTSLAIEQAKRHWWKILLALTVFGFIIWNLSKPKGQKFKFSKN